MMDQAACYQSTDRIGWITLNRPGNRNSMTPELLGAFAQASEEAKNDPDIRCVVITGKGSCFSAGADFKSTFQGGRETLMAHERSYAFYKPFLSVLDLEVPVIGALNGHAVGGGFGLSLVCDMRVANEKAKYGANFARIGFSSGMAISYLLPRLVGLPKASEMLYTGELVRGNQAAEMGMMNYAVPQNDVLPKAKELAAKIASNSPAAVRIMKKTMMDGLDWQSKRAAYYEAFGQSNTLMTDDAKEGMQALLEKRDPKF